MSTEQIRSLMTDFANILTKYKVRPWTAHVQPWRFSDGTGLTGKIVMPDGSEADADKENTDGGFWEDFYFIVTDKCTECKGFHEEPQCAAVCPVDCCIPDEENVETEDQLLAKKKWMHI